MGTNSIEYTRQYYEKNKERIKQIMAQKIICGHCESVIVRSHMSKHHQTKKCKQFKMKWGIKLLTYIVLQAKMSQQEIQVYNQILVTEGEVITIIEYVTKLNDKF